MYINFSSDIKYIFSFSSLLSLEERSPYIQFLFFKKLHFFLLPHMTPLINYCGRQNPKDVPSSFLSSVIQSNTYVGTTVKELCKCN